MTEHGLELGDKDIYHYKLEEGSLFKVANGVEPWTLKEENLHHKRLAGISLIMQIPTIIESKDALSIYLEKTNAIAQKVDGVIKDQQQKLLSHSELESLFNNYQ